MSALLLLALLSLPGASEAEELYVAVPPGAVLFASPDRYENAVVLDGEPLRRYLMRVVADRGEWLEVENAGAPRRLRVWCADSLSGIEAITLRFFVRREDLTPLVARRLTHRFKDGTWIELSAGMPIRAIEPDGRALVHAARFEVRVPLEARDMAFVTPVESPTVLDRYSGEWVPEGIEAAFGDGQSGKIPSPHGSSGLVFEDLRRHGLGSMVTVRSACAALRVKVPWRPDPRSGGVFGLRIGDRLAPLISAHAGAPLFWPDGSPAGHVNETFVLGAAFSQEGQRECFRVSLTSYSPDALGWATVCLNPEDVMRRDGEAPRLRTFEPLGPLLPMSRWDSGR